MNSNRPPSYEHLVTVDRDTFSFTIHDSYPSENSPVRIDCRRDQSNQHRRAIRFCKTHKRCGIKFSRTRLGFGGNQVRKRLRALPGAVFESESLVNEGSLEKTLFHIFPPFLGVESRSARPCRQLQQVPRYFQLFDVCLQASRNRVRIFRFCRRTRKAAYGKGGRMFLFVPNL